MPFRQGPSYNNNVLRCTCRPSRYINVNRGVPISSSRGVLPANEHQSGGEGAWWGTEPTRDPPIHPQYDPSRDASGRVILLRGEERFPRYIPQETAKGWDTVDQIEGLEGMSVGSSAMQGYG